MDLFTVLVALLVILVVYLAVNGFRKHKSFPPGPPKLPILGSAPYLLEKGKLVPLDSLERNQFMLGNYGKVGGFYIGGLPITVFSDYEVMKEVFKKDAASGRSKSRYVHDPRPGGKTRTDGYAGGLIPSVKAEWVEQRRFALRTLRDFGFAKTSMEEAIWEEVAGLVNLIKKEEGRPISLHHTVNVSIVNALWKLMVGESFEDLKDPRLQEVVVKVDALLTENPPLGILSSILPYQVLTLPLLRDYVGLTSRREIFDSMTGLIQPYVDEHLKSFDPAQPDRDFIDAYIREIRANGDSPESSFHGDKGLVSLMSTLIDLFVAGSDTTSTSVVWAILHLAHHPDMQEKAQAELDSVFGRSSMPNLARGTREALPYTHAVVSECFRKTSLAHMGVPHTAMEDIVVGDYVIPKDGLMLQNLYSVHHDPDYWENPHEFYPQHFLDGDRKYRSRDRLVPFGVGKRYCLGQSLAEQEFFLFLTGLLHRFTVGEEPKEPLPSYEVGVARSTNLVRNPPHFKVRMVSRDEH